MPTHTSRSGVGLFLWQFEAAPEIPGRNRAVWPPLQRQFLHLFGRWQLFQAIDFLDCHAHAEVAYGQDVPALQAEHEEHVRGPGANSLHLSEALDHQIVGQFCEAMELDLGLAGGEVADVGGFLLRQAAAAHGLFGEGEDGPGLKRFAGEGRESGENHRSHFPAKLLVDNGAGQRVERRLHIFHSEGPNGFDYGPQLRIGRL